MNTVDTLDTRWEKSSIEWLYLWHEYNGVFSYALHSFNNQFWVRIERCDAGKARQFGPYKNHETATKIVVKHIEGGR